MTFLVFLAVDRLSAGVWVAWGGVVTFCLVRCYSCYIFSFPLLIVSFDVLRYLVVRPSLFGLMFLHILLLRYWKVRSWCSYISCSTLIIVCLDVLTYLVLRCSLYVLVFLHVLFYADHCMS